MNAFFDGRKAPSRAVVAFTCIGIVMLSFLAYARSVRLPLISDDYLQITLARDYGPVTGWPALLQDALYRCRATSLILTYWTERWFGADPFPLNLSSLTIHILNALLVFAMGVWRPIGWRVSAVAACVFAVSQRHHEAVIWYAALPELLVFFFSMSSFLCGVLWLQSERGSRAAYLASFGLFLAALASKESAVVVPPLLLVAAVLQRTRLRAAIGGLVPFAICAAVYFGLIFAARSTHLHFNDAGTFSLGAPFVSVMLRSSLTLIGVWGSTALAALWVWNSRHWVPLLWLGAVWAAIAFLPYSFLTYNPSVPSRHTYLASVGSALVLAAALLEFHARTVRKHGYTPIALVGAVLVAHQCSYLWIKKQAQFEDRAWPTEELVRIATQSDSPIHVKCFPYDKSVAALAVNMRVPRAGGTELIFGVEPGRRNDGVDLCTAPAR